MLCLNVLLKLHQHRRLTRAQSHHGSEEERKRRKILARKVGGSRVHHTHTAIQRSLMTSQHQHERTAWLVMTHSASVTKTNVVTEDFQNVSHSTSDSIITVKQYETLSLFSFLLLNYCPFIYSRSPDSRRMKMRKTSLSETTTTLVSLCCHCPQEILKWKPSCFQCFYHFQSVVVNCPAFCLCLQVLVPVPLPHAPPPPHPHPPQVCLSVHLSTCLFVCLFVC